METLTIFDWLIVSCVSLVPLLSVLFLFYMVLLIKNRKKIHHFEKIKIKNKKHKKSVGKRIRKYTTTQKNIVKKLFLLAVFMILFLGIALGVKNYQAARLNMKDQQDIADSYYYLKQLDDQLEATEKDSENILENIDVLSSKLAIYAIKRADQRLSKEGQIAINKYYRSLKELGINIASQPKDFYTDPILLNSVKEDIKKVKKNEQAVFHKFEIDSNSLSEQQ